ncbi:MAG: DUF393 domain-containing protein [Gemmatimonadetes bacterium]|nr:DUF393 domain-containing protein [Gemmatimonadota bacterium]
MTESAGGPILFYDGECALCHRAVRFVYTRDRGDIFRYAPLQGRTAASLGVSRDGDAGETLILYEDGEILERSGAVLRIVELLDGFWGWFRVFRIVPRPVRDALYRFVARIRFRVFGRSDVCLIPDSDRAGRLLD